MPRFVSRAEMDAVSKQIYPLLPAQFRDVLPADAQASAQNSEIFRDTLQLMPRLVTERFAQVKPANAKRSGGLVTRYDVLFDAV